MKAYSLDLRERIVQAVGRGMTKAATARAFSVSLATVKNYVRRWDQTGGLTPNRIPGRPARIAAEEHAALIAQLQSASDATLAEHVQTWAQTHGVTLSSSAFWRAIKRVGWTRKKRLWVPANATRMFAPPGEPPLRRHSDPAA